MVSPMMTRNNLRFYAFYVPNRILDDAWESFIYGNEDGTSGHQPLLKLNGTYLSQDPLARKLYDYLGYVPLTADISGRTFEFRYPYPLLAYCDIWNEYFRDQNLQDALPIHEWKDENGDFYVSTVRLRYKAWEKDYFTSALPFLQRGPASSLPISFSGSDVTTVIKDSGNKSDTSAYFEQADGTWSSYSGDIVYDSEGNLIINDRASGGNALKGIAFSNLSKFLQAESTLEEIEASFLINDFRKANKLQAFLEKNARAGARPTEQLRAHFGVKPSDARLQRPEFLGALTMPISISEVLQHSESSQSGTPLGEMGGHGIGVTGNRLFKNRFFEEHGVMMVLACVVPRSSYFGGLDRRFIKLDRFSYYWPEFANIGEQPVYKSELFFNDTSVPDYNSPEEVFGYQERYAEYRFRNDEVHGKMQTDLKFWHQARSFDSSVALNGDFISCKPDDRIFALQDDNPDTEQIYANFLFKPRMSRIVTPRGIPSL